MLDTGGRAGALGFLSSRGHLIALALLVGLALFLRLYGINWDQGGLYHPDERAIVMKVSQITFPTGDLGSLFTDESALNPAWFPYGSLPLYLLKLTGFLAPPFFDDPSLEKLAIMGRAISALADVATIVLIYVVGSRLFGRWAGLLGASVITLSALHIQQSHFFVTDIMLAAMLMASFLFLSRAMEDGRLKTFALAALFFGLALSTKFSASPFALAFIAAGALWAFREGRGHPELRGRLIHGTKALFMSGGITILVFAIAQPYAIIDIDTYASYIARESDMVRRISDLPFTRQYVDTTPYWYQVQQLATWGVGLPFGLLLWGGFAFSLVMGLWRRDGRHLLMLSWVVPYFALVGSFDVKFMRYMLPITPFLAIMGGSLVTWTVGWLREHQRFFLRPQLIYGLVAVAMVATLLYAVSYSRIYSQPHTATSAAAWINANVPTGSTLVKEHWEEGIRDLYNYQHKDLDLYNDENPTKRLHMIQRLVEADYLLFYSNRLYSTIPRLEERYPMTGAYYASLFGGELGFELVHWESSYPNLFGLSLAHDTFSRVNLAVPISLQGYKQTPAQWTVGFADESFTVYDHPLVLIFRKAISGPTQQQAEFFDSVLPQPGTVSNDTLGAELLLSPDDLRAQQEGGTRSRIFNRDSFVNSVPAVVWFLVVQLAFLLALPITLLIFRWLPDRGYLLGKMLGLLLISYVPWLLASLQWLSFSRFSVFLGMVLVGLASAVILKFKWRDMLTFLREHRRMILVGEGLFAVAFAGLFAVRLWNPDLWHPFFGGEKPMDFAYFNAVVRSTYMPPYDPWFSGGQLNYYYFGFFMNAAFTKLTGILPSIAINLAVPLFFALTAAGAFSIVYNLASLAKGRMSAAGRALQRMPSPIWAGLMAAVFVGVIGNLDGIVQVAQGKWFGSFSYWRSSRMLGSDLDGITEFPFFTFLFADPHAHLFVIPLTLLALGLALAFVVGARRQRLVGLMAWGPYVVLGMTLGAIQATNSWDAPTYLIVGGGAILIAEYASRKSFDPMILIYAGAKTAGVYVLGYLFFLPFQQNYETFLPITDSLQASDGQAKLHLFLGIHGFFLVVIGSFLAYELWRHFGSSFRPPRGPVIVGFQLEAGAHAAIQTLGWTWSLYVAGTLLAVMILALLGYATVGFLIGMLALIAPLMARELARREEGMPVQLFVMGIIALPMLLAIGVDLFNVNLPLGRMNTVFKVYLQAWVLMSLASAYILWRLRFGEVFGNVWVRRGWQSFIVLLVASSLIYPVMATPARASERFLSIGPTADGMAFMNEGALYNYDAETWVVLRHERQAIEWLQDNVQGSPVVVDGLGQTYRTLRARVSTYTGLPTVIGYDWHQKQQRWGFTEVVDRRVADVERFYRTSSETQAMDFLRRYNVRYVYVGQHERLEYPEAGIAKFDTMAGEELTLVYENEQVKIFEVRGG